MLAVIIGAFVDRDFFPRLPAEESVIAVGAEVLRLIVFTKALISLEQMAADLASKLGFFLAVIVVEIVVRGITERADDQLWN